MSKVSGIFPFLHSQIDSICETESTQSFFQSICDSVNVRVFVFVLTNQETRGLLSLMEKYHFLWYDNSPVSYKSTLRVVKEKCTFFAPFAGYNEILHSRYFTELEGNGYAVLSLQEFARLLKDANARQENIKHSHHKTPSRYETFKELMRRVSQSIIQRYIKKNG